MAKALITTNAGTKISIEGSSSEIKEIIPVIKRLEGGADRISDESAVDYGVFKNKRKRINSIQKSNTATDVILALREQDYFDKPKNLLEIKNALEEQGMIYPVTTLSPILLRLVRKRLIGRVKSDKRWCYVKR